MLHHNLAAVLIIFAAACLERGERMSDKSKGIIFVAFIILGMVITMQFRTILSARQPNVIGESSIQKLTDELEQIRSEGLKLHEQLQQIEKEIEEAERRLRMTTTPL